MRKKFYSFGNCKLKKSLIISNTMLLIALCGCNGNVSHSNSSSSSDEKSVSYQVQIIDGSVSGASVCIDTNLDFECDTDSEITDESGKATININSEKSATSQYTFIANIPKDATTFYPGEANINILRDNLMVAYLCPGDNSTTIQLSSFTTLAAAKNIDNCQNYEDHLTNITSNLDVDVKTDFNQANNKALIVNAMLEQTGMLPEDIDLFKSYSNKDNIDKTIENYTKAATKVLSLNNSENSTTDNISTAKAIAGYEEARQDLIIEGRAYAYPNSLEWIKNNYFYWDYKISDDENINKINNYVSTFTSSYTDDTSKANISGREDFNKKIVDYLYNLNTSKAFDKKAVIVLGLPAAGKSTVLVPLTEGVLTSTSVDLYPEENGNYLLIDPDEVKTILPEYNNGLLENVLQKESTNVRLSLLEKAYENGANFCLPTLGAESNYLEKFYANKIKGISDQGYKITVVFVDVPVEISKERNKGRLIKTGRYVPFSLIESIGTKIGDNFCTLMNDSERNGNVVRFVWLDNSDGSKIILDGVPTNTDDISKLNALCSENGYSYSL